MTTDIRMGDLWLATLRYNEKTEIGVIVVLEVFGSGIGIRVEWDDGVTWVFQHVPRSWFKHDCELLSRASMEVGVC